MHDSEKSDSAIVAVKPPNKTGQPVAEAVEPRAGAKGNADQQSTHRTQSRIRVTQALSRVRQAAGTSLARSALRRQTPKVGAGCSNWARPDPRGGCPAMGIPTAILDPKRSLAFQLSLRDDETVALHRRLRSCIGNHKVLRDAIGKIDIIGKG